MAQAECRSEPNGSVKLRERRRGHPERLLDGDLRHALDLDRDDRDPPGLALDLPALRPSARRAAPTGPLSSAITSVPCAQLAGAAGERLARGRVADAERRPRARRRRRRAARRRSRRSRSSARRAAGRGS